MATSSVIWTLLIVLSFSNFQISSATIAMLRPGPCNSAVTGNCAAKTEVPSVQCFNKTNSTYTFHKCGYCDAEKELGIKVIEKKGIRIPDDHFKASSELLNKYYGAARARIGMKPVGEYKEAWCAGPVNPEGIWLQVYFDLPTDIERIETKGITDGGVEKWISHYCVNYSSDGTTWMRYKHGMIFNSSIDISSHDVFINKTNYVRIISKSSQGGNCLQLAIYGCSTGPQIDRVADPPAAPATTPTGGAIIGSADMTNTMFNKGYQLWLMFLVVFLVLIFVSLLFLFCMLRRNTNYSKSGARRAETADIFSPGYVPTWRRVDPQAEKGYVAKQEIQQVEVAFGGDYDPHVEKKREDPNDPVHYQDRNRIFSFSGRQTDLSTYNSPTPQA